MQYLSLQEMVLHENTTFHRYLFLSFISKLAKGLLFKSNYFFKKQIYSEKYFFGLQSAILLLAVLLSKQNLQMKFIGTFTCGRDQRQKKNFPSKKQEFNLEFQTFVQNIYFTFAIFLKLHVYFPLCDFILKFRTGPEFLQM